MGQGTVFFDAEVIINSVDLSDHVVSVTLPVTVATHDDTTMGTDGWTSVAGGMKSWQVDVEFVQDYAAGEVDATLWPLLGTTTTISVMPNKTDGIGVGNPKFSGSVIVSNYTGADLSVGALGKNTTSFPGAGTLTRATA
jgi:hypothetical protein